MSFFDSKEEVLNIELTQFGKKLLSKGKFKPVYYAFFDDDIVYDSQYMNVTENQNETQERILKNTAFSKPVYNFHSVEEESSQIASYLVREDLTSISNLDKLDLADGETNYSLLLPLGKSSLNSQYYPAWNFKALNGQISTVQEYINNANSNEFTKYPYLKIPQINMETSSIKVDVYDEDTVNSATAGQLETVQIIQKEEKTFYVKRGEVFNIFDIIESNVDDRRDNFEVEIFVEDVKEVNKLIKTYWRRLNFPKKPVAIKDGILLDEPLNKDSSNVIFNNTYANYYLNVLVDDEINLPPEQRLAVNAYDTNITDADRPFGEDC